MFRKAADHIVLFLVDVFAQIELLLMSRNILFLYITFFVLQCTWKSSNMYFSTSFG